MNASLLLFVSAVLSVFIGGCSGDLITYSKEARRQGMTFSAQQDYPKALGAYRSAVRQNARDYQSYFYLGDTYEKLNQPLEAITSYKTSLEVQPLTEDGRADGAQRVKTLDALGAVIAKADPRDIEVNQLEAKAAASSTGEEYYVLARAYAGRGDADSAIEAFNKGVLQNAKSPTIAKAAGLYFEQLGQKTAAETMLRNAYRLDPTDAEVSAALRRMGIVPGPSLLGENELAKPFLPRGPIPEIPVPGRKLEPAPTPRPAPTAPPLPGPAE